MSAQIPACLGTCATVPPLVEFDFCNPELNFGEIQKIYWTSYASAGFTDITNILDPAWLRIDNAGSDPDVIRELDVIGSKAAPESTEIELSLDRTVKGLKTHTVTFKIDDTSALNHAMIRELECGFQLRVWYANGEGLIWGGDDGIVASITLDEIIPETNDELITFEGTMKWKSKFSPERDVNPQA